MMRIRVLLTRLGVQHPDWDRDQLCAAFIEEARQDEECVTEALHRCFDNDYRVLVGPPPNPEPPRRSIKSEDVKDARSRLQRIVLMDLILPTGKRLRESTGDDCAKAGGWLRAIARVVNPTEVVGAVLNEEQVREMFDQRDADQ
jgi:hypothetical protein